MFTKRRRKSCHSHATGIRHLLFTSGSKAETCASYRCPAQPNTQEPFTWLSPSLALYVQEYICTECSFTSVFIGLLRSLTVGLFAHIHIMYMYVCMRHMIYTYVHVHVYLYSFSPIYRYVIYIHRCPYI